MTDAAAPGPLAKLRFERMMQARQRAEWAQEAIQRPPRAEDFVDIDRREARKRLQALHKAAEEGPRTWLGDYAFELRARMVV